MAVEYRKNRRRWGYRFRCRGRIYKSYVFKSKRDAAVAEREKLHDLEHQEHYPAKSLGQAVNDFLIDSIKRGRTKEHIDALYYNFHRQILPYFGAETSINKITTVQVDEFIRQQLMRVSASTVWHYVTNLRAVLNFCKVPLKIDMSPLKFRRKPKPPLDPRLVERAAEVLEGYDRAYFDFCRFTGCHKDEANNVQWIDVVDGYVHIRGTKNQYRDRYVPLHPVVAAQLATLPRSSPYVFPNRRTGEKQYSRDKLMARIKRLTGISLKVKDLRDYFATMLPTNDMRLLMELLGHSSLETTTIYVRQIRGGAAVEAVRSMEANSGGNTQPQTMTIYPKLPAWPDPDGLPSQLEPRVIIGDSYPPGNSKTYDSENADLKKLK